MENLLARTEASQTRLNHRFTKFAHTFSNLTIEDLQLAIVKRRLDQDLKLEGLLAVTACHRFLISCPVFAGGFLRPTRTVHATLTLQF